MSLKAVGIMMVMLITFFLLYNTFGMGIANLIISILLLLQAIVFSIKDEYYDKFLKFMNPRLYNVYCQKGSVYIRKTRKMNIIFNYLISIITGFNAFIQLSFATFDTRHLFSFREFLPFAAIILIIVFILNHISIFIMKKSKTSTENLMWSIIIGIGISIVLIGVVGIFILLLLL